MTCGPMMQTSPTFSLAGGAARDRRSPVADLDDGALASRHAARTDPPHALSTGQIAQGAQVSVSPALDQGGAGQASKAC
jgi:hypothetical protein